MALVAHTRTHTHSLQTRAPYAESLSVAASLVAIGVCLVNISFGT